MAVIVQPMVSTVAQGTLATVDPITGNADVFVLEITEGPLQGVHVLDPYARRPGELHFWSRLRHLGLMLDEHARQYRMLEWIITDEDDLYIMRVRPVTGAGRYLPEAERHVSAGNGPLELVRPPGTTARTMPPYSWYHRSRSPRLSAAYLRESSPLFAPLAGRDEYYPCGYL
jgi:hypothetical protein